MKMRAGTVCLAGPGFGKTGLLAAVLLTAVFGRAQVALNSSCAATGGVSLASTPVIATNGTGVGSAANPWVYVFAPNTGTFAMGDYAITNANGNSFKLNLNGMSVTATSGRTNFLTAGPTAAQSPDNARGSVSLVNAGDLSIGAIDTRVTAFVNGNVTKSGSITLGNVADGAVGNVRADFLNASSLASGYVDTGAGSVNIWGTGSVSIQTAGGAAGDIQTCANHAGGAITAQHQGSFQARDVLSYTLGNKAPGTVTLTGTNVAGGAVGGLLVRTIDTSGKLTSSYDVRPATLSGSITIQAYTNVYVSGDLLAYANANGYVDVTYLGNIVITNCGDIRVDGQIDTSATNAPTQTAHWGTISMTSTGRITLGSLNLGKTRAATLSATNGTTITGDLLNFPTNTPANGLLDAPTNKVIYYTWNLPNNTYLKNTNYTLKSGGKLIAQAADIPVVANAAVSNVTSSTAFLNGSLVATGRTPVTVSVYWGTSNGGTNLSAWANTNTFARGQWNQGDSIWTNITTLAANTNYYYNYYALADGGGTWAANGVASFITGGLTVQATDATARGNAVDTGTFTVYRPAGCTNEALVVNYLLGGTAAQGTDYSISPASGAVIIPRGQTSGVITVAPIFKLDAQKTVVLSITNGPYALGSPVSDTVTLAAVTPITSDVVLTNSTTVTGRVSLASTPAIYASSIIGAGTAASPWLYPFSPYTNGTFIMTTNQLKTANGDSFKLDLDGLAITGTSGATNFLTAGPANTLGSDNARGSVTLVNAGDIAMGAIDTRVTSGSLAVTKGGTITLGSASAGAVGNIRVDSLNSSAAGAYTDPGAGAISVYGTGSVAIATSGGTAGNIDSSSAQSAAGSVNVQHNGSFLAYDILTWFGGYNWGGNAASASFNGAVGGAGSGDFAAHTIDASARKVDDQARTAGSITIQGYRDVAITSNLLAYAGHTADTHRPGNITITCGGNLVVAGMIDAGLRDVASPTRANLGVVSLAATGTITLANLDLGKLNTATLAAGRGTTIKGYLLNFPTGTSTNGWLDAPTNRIIYYNPNNASNAYLNALTYTLKSGGILRKSSTGTAVFFR